MTRRKLLQKLHFLAPAAIVIAGVAGHAQTVGSIAQPINPAQAQVLPNHHPLWAVPANDAGAVPANLPLQNLTLVLARSPQQEQAFEQLLSAQQDPTSPEFHHWLTAEAIGERFGLSEDDIAAITGWLQSQGLEVNWVAPSRVFIGFSGTAADVGRAFQTEFHYYNVRGQQRISVATDPMVPVALASAVKSVRGLFTIEDRPFHVIAPQESSAPNLTITSGGVTYHFLAPADFATIYDLPAGLTGAGTTIGIVAEARTDPADFNNFKGLTGSTFSNPTEVVPTAFGGADPGPAYTTQQNCGSSSSCAELMDLQGEATLDVLRSGSVAPGASLLSVVASSASGGIAVDAEYIVESTPVPAQVMTISFGACESEGGSSGVDFWDTLFQQAAGEGISVFVSSGDSGASGCDANFSTPPADPLPNSPNYICSSSYDTCVGGTEFNDSSNPSAYWSSNNDADLASAFGYIPEGAWNEPLNSDSEPQVASSGGGVSDYILTPSWQTGTGVPTARAGRYTPDVSFSASEHDGYFACFAANGGSCISGPSGTPFDIFAGTSAAAPGMAGVAALLDQKSAAPQGNLNPSIYNTASSYPAAFHQVSVASSGVSGCAVATPSMCNNSIPGPTGLSGGQAGYQLGQNGGYSEVTGLGSLDVGQFLDDSSGSSSITPTVTLSAPPTVTTAQSASVEITVTGDGSTVPTGSVVLSNSTYTSASTALDIPGPNSNSVFIVIPSGVLALGTDTLTAYYTSNSSTYYNASGSTSIVVTSAEPAPPITWATPAPIPYGTALSATQLDATTTVAGAFSYSPAAGAVLTAGQHTLTVVFTPNDTADYSSATASVTLTVTQLAPVLSWADPAPVPAGTVLSATQLNATANVPGTFTYTPAAGTLLSATGNFALSVAFAPTDSTDYTTANDSVTITVTAATLPPVVTTSGATAVASSSATLNGQATANGTDTHVWFLYGTSSTLSGASQTAEQDIGSGFTNTSVNFSLTGLTASTTYYFQIAAQNASGATMGSIQSFTTPTAAAFTVAATAVTISQGATTGNTSTISVTPANGFTGSVTLSAAVTSSPAGAQDMPVLSWIPTGGQVAITGAGAASATLVIYTTPASAAANQVPANPAGRWYATGGSALACIVLFWIPVRRRSWRNALGMVALCLALVCGATACSSSNTVGVVNAGTTSGSYTITVTASSGSVTATGTVPLSVQ